jgi:glutamate-1-semialdehyde 2,1-aminomutase
MKKVINNCLKIQETAKKRIPGMTQLLSKRPDMFSLGVWPGYYQKAIGCNVTDLDSNEYIDMSISGIGANILGYADPDVDDAVKKAIREGSSSSLNCVEEVELAEVLCQLHPWADMVRYSRTGGEAMVISVRIARACTGRDKIAFCGYHGWHDWYLAANLGSDSVLNDHLLEGLSSAGVPKGLTGTALPFRYNHPEELNRILNENKGEIAAVVMEPLRSTFPDPGFLEGVKSQAEKEGAVFILDEVSAGFRLCAGGAHLKLKVNPDIAVFSKALGNGYPIAAIIGRQDVMEAAQSTFISSTYWTERIGPTAALAVIKKYQEKNVSEHLGRIGTMVQNGWKKAAEANNLDISVGGMLPTSHFSFPIDNWPEIKAYFVQLMLEKGFLASNLCYAMLAHTEEHVQNYLSAVEESFADIRTALDEGSLKRKCKGLPANAGFKRIA